MTAVDPNRPLETLKKESSVIGIGRKGIGATVSALIRHGKVVEREPPAEHRTSAWKTYLGPIAEAQALDTPRPIPEHIN